MVTSKLCTRCRLLKALDDFSPDRRHSTGRQSHCRSCKAQAQAQYRSSHPEKWMEWYARNRRHRLDWMKARA